MTIIIRPKMINGRRGFHYTCDCGNPDLFVEKDDDIYCQSCDSWREYPDSDDIRRLHEAVQKRLRGLDSGEQNGHSKHVHQFDP